MLGAKKIIAKPAISQRNAVYERFNGDKIMATIGENNKAVLLVVDVQVGVMRAAWDSPRIIKNINTVVEKARSHGVPVIWVQHSDNELVYDSPDWQLVPELSPAEDEIHLYKNFNSSFEQTSLADTLARLGATHIILAGAATNWCIRATAYGALDRGYDLTLIKDAHTTETIVFEDGTKIEASDMILELNIAMKWLSYPGRTNSTISTAALNFMA
jgi:nicotinamidase-related amidase